MADENKPKSIPITLEKERKYEFESGRTKYQYIVNSTFKDEGETLDKILLRLILSDTDEIIHQQGSTEQ